MALVYTFLLCSAISLLFLFEDSTASRLAVGVLVGICILGALLPFLPAEWIEAVPSGFTGLGRRVHPRAMLGILLALAVGYPITASLLYPLRNKLMTAFARRYGKKR